MPDEEQDADRDEQIHEHGVDAGSVSGGERGHHPGTTAISDTHYADRAEHHGHERRVNFRLHFIATLIWIILCPLRPPSNRADFSGALVEYSGKHSANTSLESCCANGEPVAGKPRQICGHAESAPRPGE